MRKSNDSSIGRSCSDIRTCFRSLSIVLSERDVEVVGHDASSLRQRIGDYFAALFDDVLFVYFFKNKFRIYNILLFYLWHYWNKVGQMYNVILVHTDRFDNLMISYNNDHLLCFRRSQPIPNDSLTYAWRGSASFTITWRYLCIDCY